MRHLKPIRRRILGDTDAIMMNMPPELVGYTFVYDGVLFELLSDSTAVDALEPVVEALLPESGE